jgi:hypothetical protein
MANKVDTWNQLMSVAVTMPGVKVNREKFLTKVLKHYCNAEKLSIALKGMPVNVVPQRIIDNLATSTINWHTAKVTGASVATGLGGFMTIPADIIQYYWHVLVLSQKLTYLYGFPDLCDDDGNIPEDSQNLLTVFIAIMMGATIAGKGLQYIIERAARQATRTLPEIAVAETLYYPIIKQATKWIGKRLERNSITKSMRKSIPILGCLLSGTIAFATFRPGALRLMNELKRETILLQKKEMDLVS